MQQQYKRQTVLFSFGQTKQQDHSKFVIKNNNYFLLVNKKYDKALCFPHNTSYEKSKAILKQVDQNDIDQIFQIQQILDNKFQIVHSASTLVLQAQQKQVKLSFGKWKSNQFFCPNKVSNAQHVKNYYWLNLQQNTNKHIFFDQKLQCSQINLSRDQTTWQLKLCLNNKVLNKSCWLQYAYSNKVIDIPQASQKSQIKLIQYSCNFRFNQRFTIQRSDKYFKIISLKTNQCLSCKNIQQDAAVIQEQNSNSIHQLWNIQYTGSNIYIIRSAKDPNLVLSVKDININDQAIIVLGSIQQFGFWKIIGNFLITQNRDFKF